MLFEEHSALPLFCCCLLPILLFLLLTEYIRLVSEIRCFREQLIHNVQQIFVCQSSLCAAVLASHNRCQDTLDLSGKVSISPDAENPSDRLECRLYSRYALPLLASVLHPWFIGCATRRLRWSSGKAKKTLSHPTRSSCLACSTYCLAVLHHRKVA